jgi:polyhydroxyalkanoate synthesis regulator phasin
VPLPTPKDGEARGDFISRCISFEAKASPDRPHVQVVAMCHTAWKRAKGVKASEDYMPELKVALLNDNKGYEKVNVKLSGVRLWRKQVLRFGKWKHPENKDIEFEITPAVLSQVLNNFNAGVPVEAPVVLTHTDDPRMKRGRVKSFVVTDTGLDAIMTVDDAELNENLDNEEKAPGVSCWLDLNYIHKETGEKLGAVVKHVALVNHPYIEGMEGFQAVLSEAEEGEKYLPLVYLSEKEKTKSKSGGDDMPKLKKELIEALKTDHEIDVEALLGESKQLAELQGKIEKGEFISAEDAKKVMLSDELVKKIREALELSEDTDIDVASVILKLLESGAAKKTELSEATKRIDDLEEKIDKRDAEASVSTLLSEGFIFPKEKKVYEALYLSDKKAFDELVTARKESGKVIKLTEEGTTHGDNDSTSETADEVKERNIKAGKEEGIIK